MFLKVETQRTLQVSNVEDHLLTWLEAFLIDRKAGGVAVGTMRFYRQKIKLFSDYCDAQAVKQIGQINPSFLRQLGCTRYGATAAETMLEEAKKRGFE